MDCYWISGITNDKAKSSGVKGKLVNNPEEWMPNKRS